MEPSDATGTYANISGGTSNTAGSTISSWQFCQCDFTSIKDGTEKVKEAVLFDSRSTDHLFSNRNLVEKVWKVNSGITFNTNGGEIGTTEVAEFAPLEDEEIWFNNRDSQCS